MPSHVKAFWRLSVATVACWAISAISAVWHLMIFPSAERLALVARVAQRHPEIQRIAVIEIIIVPAVLCGATLGIAWLAAIRRKNWARWLAIVFLLHDPIAVLAVAFILNPLHPSPATL